MPINISGSSSVGRSQAIRPQSSVGDVASPATVSEVALCHAYSGSSTPRRNFQDIMQTVGVLVDLGLSTESRLREIHAARPDITHHLDAHLYSLAAVTGIII